MLNRKYNLINSIKTLFIFVINIIRFNYKNIFIFPFYHTGGAEKVHLQILETVNSSKETLILITQNSTNNHFYDAYKKKGFLIEISLFEKTINKIFTRILLIYLNLSNSTKVIFSCNTSYFYDLLPHIKNKKIHKKDLLHAFSYPDFGMENISINYVNYLDERVVINKKTKEDYATQYQKYNIAEDFLNKITIIENAVEIPNEFIKKTNIKLKILFCGRNSVEKRPYIFYKIAEKCIDFADFYIAGDFDNEKERLNQLKISEMGEIQTVEALYNLYKEMDLLLITSYREGFPMVIMEAMANKVCIISTDVGGIAEHILDAKNGYLIPSEGLKNEEIVALFYEKIKLLAHNKLILNNIQETSYKYAKHNFNLIDFHKKYYKILSC